MPGASEEQTQIPSIEMDSEEQPQNKPKNSKKNQLKAASQPSVDKVPGKKGRPSKATLAARAADEAAKKAKAQTQVQCDNTRTVNNTNALITPNSSNAKEFVNNI
jgi:hypothetical protein